jgi:hypothetical protein
VARAVSGPIVQAPSIDYPPTAALLGASKLGVWNKELYFFCPPPSTRQTNNRERSKKLGLHAEDHLLQNSDPFPWEGIIIRAASTFSCSLSGSIVGSCWDRSSVFDGIDRRLLLESTIGFCWNRPQAAR